jgi:hypothetical protein
MAVTVLVIEARPFHRVHTFSQPVLSWSPDLYLTTRSYILQSLMECGPVFSTWNDVACLECGESCSHYTLRYAVI